MWEVAHINFNSLRFLQMCIRDVKDYKCLLELDCGRYVILDFLSVLVNNQLVLLVLLTREREREVVVGIERLSIYTQISTKEVK